MYILLLRHYPLVEGNSMRRYADQISIGLQKRGHTVEVITAPVIFGSLFQSNKSFTKWLGYLDRFLIFPPLLLLKVLSLPRNILCVLTDQALAPWLPWLANRPHVIHCHDFLALDASLGLQHFHKLGRIGKLYQFYILQGFRRGNFFLSVSKATKCRLETYLLKPFTLSEVLYNPLNDNFSVLSESDSYKLIQATLPQILKSNYLFHIGRNWYKNRRGVLEIWAHLHLQGLQYHLVMIGSLEPALQSWINLHPQLKLWLHVLDTVDDKTLVALYNRASLLLFPSHAEGFGWPILEALACGCPVVTTGLPPMTEVGGSAATTIPPAPTFNSQRDEWASNSAKIVSNVLTRTDSEKSHIQRLGFDQCSLFVRDKWLDQLENYYFQAHNSQSNN